MEFLLLKKIIDGEGLNDVETAEFGRFGDLFGQIDWRSEYYKRHEHPELCVIATRLRPIFYEKLIELRVLCDRDYSERIYQTFKSAGKKVNLSPQELVQTQQVLQAMSDEILSRLQYVHAESDPD